VETDSDYDERDRLRSETTGTDTITYGYNTNGSQTTKTDNGILQSTRVWDARGRMVELLDGSGATLASYQYTPDGIRSAVTEGGVTTQYQIDELSPSGYAEVVEERVGGQVVASYVYGVGTAPISMSRDTNGTPGSLETTVLYLQDGHSGVRQAVATSTGAVVLAQRFDAFGGTVAHAGTLTNVIGYRGERFDAVLGEYDLRARDYDPATGRFTAMDPAAGTYSDPMQLMRYGYAGANPVAGMDPSGMFGELAISFSISLSLQLPAVVKGAIITTAMMTFGNLAGKLRNEGLALLAEGEVEAGMLLTDVAGQVFGMGAFLAQAGSDAIDTFMLALFGINVIRGVAGFVRNGGLSNLATKVRGLINGRRSLDSAMMMNGAEWIGAGRRGGQVLTEAEIASIRDMLMTAQINRCATGERVSVFVLPASNNPASMDYIGEVAGALHRVRPQATNYESIIYYRPGCTYYEMMHEVEHALHFLRVGPARFYQLTDAQREMAVYLRLRQSGDWNFFTSAERADAERQLFGPPGGFLDGSRGPQMPPPGSE